MRQRVTYILRDTDFNPSEGLTVSSNALSVSGLNGAKEHQLTASLDELPSELRQVLAACHELHLRWSTPRPYASIAPFVSRVSPGLHVFYTPLKNKPTNNLCVFLKKIFGTDIKCDFPESTFISPPILSERFSSSSAKHYYQYMPTISDLILWIEHKVCKVTHNACLSLARSLQHADYLDADYDSIAHTFKLTVYWSQARTDDEVWTDSHESGKGQTIEVGVLMNEKPSEPEELKFSGWLTIPGENKEPSATMFETPARHHTVSLAEQVSFQATFQQPTGMHPVMQLSFQANAMAPPAPSCALHTYLTLPSTLFVDRYPFSDELFVKSHNLKALRTLSGATDLEAPDWVVDQWGSAALLELASPPSPIPASGWNVTIPLHLRYMPPTDDPSGLAQTYVPSPAVFWACNAEEGTKFTTSPFDRTNLGYDGLFGPRTMFYHVSPSEKYIGRAVLDVPVLNLNKSNWAELGTIVVISLGSLYIFAQLLWSLWAQNGSRNIPTGKKTQ